MFGKWLEDEPAERYEKNDFVSVKQWLAILLVTITPALNIVMLLGWALRNVDERPASMVNFAKAMLIMMCILAVSVALAVFLVRLVGQLGHR